MSKDMCCRNRPNFNTDSGLTPNGPGPAGERPGSAREKNAAGSPRASRPALRRFFAPGTLASSAAAPCGSGGPPADVAELAAPLGRLGRAGVVAAELAAPGPPAGVVAEASSRPGTGAAVTGPDVEPDVVPTAGAGVQVLAAAARSRAFTPSPAGLVAGA